MYWCNRKRTFCLIGVFLFSLVFTNIVNAAVPMKSATAMLEDELTPDEYGGIYFEDGIVHILPMHFSRDKITKLVEETLQAYSESEVDVKIVIDNNASYTFRQLKIGYENIKDPNQKLQGFSSISTHIDVKRNAIVLELRDPVALLAMPDMAESNQTLDENWKENLIDEVQEITGVENIILDIKPLVLPVLRFVPSLILSANSNELPRYIHKDEQLVYLDTIFLDTAPYVKNNRLMLPLRDLIMAYDEQAKFVWNDKKQEWVCTFQLKEGTRMIYINTATRTIKFGAFGTIPPELIDVTDGKFFIPYSCLGVLGDASYYYDQEMHQIFIEF